MRAFANTEVAALGYFNDKPDTEPKDKLTIDSNQN